MLKGWGAYYTGNIEILSDLSKKSGCILYLGVLDTEKYGVLILLSLVDSNVQERSALWCHIAVI